MSDDIGQRLEILSKEIRGTIILNRVAKLVSQIIEQRTLAGKFLNSNAPTNYSASYEKKRLNRPGGSLPVSFVDLQFEGNMWGSFDFNFDLNKAEIELGFNRDELAKIASYHDVYGAGKNKVLHQFLGLTDSELETVSEFMLKEMGEVINITLEKDLPGL